MDCTVYLYVTNSDSFIVDVFCDLGAYFGLGTGFYETTTYLLVLSFFPADAY
jgi:hypothetical protein